MSLVVLLDVTASAWSEREATTGGAAAMLRGATLTTAMEALLVYMNAYLLLDDELEGRVRVEASVAQVLARDRALIAMRAQPSCDRAALVGYPVGGNDGLHHALATQWADELLGHR